IELKTIEFLERYADNQITDKKGNKKPFFMHCSIPDPHHPVCPPGKYKDMYKPEDINFPSTFNDIKNLEKHPFLGPLIKNPIFRMTLLRETTEEEARQFIASTYGSIAMLDNCVGNILRALDKLGLADNTTVIFTSDHGDLMGDHGFILKGPSAYEGVLKVPMIWRVPGITPNGAVSDSLMSSIDISKTILNLAKIRVKKQSPDIQGLDVTPILKDPEAKVRDHCYIEEDEELALHKIRLRHLITETHSLTKYEGVEGYGDIFDKINDPDQLHNLWNEDKELRYKLLEKLFDVSLAAQSRFPKRISPS
ncbi:MAG: sulfatase-like hydrolase/transferase, partial [archaeon]|nr:sulfatase-like hydrolase/transferase [archaeon]